MTTKEKMNSTKKTARLVGALFITATVASIVATFGIFGPILDSPDYLISISANETQWLTGVLIDAINSAAIIIIAIVLFPIFRRYSVTLALGYVAARMIESVILIIGHISQLSLLTLSQEYVQAGAPDAPYFQTLGTLLLGVYDWALLLGPMIVLGLTALILNYVLYQSRLVPRFISVWGFIGGLLMLAAGLFSVFGLSPSSTIAILLIAPLALNEMALAVWLIVKGFNLSAIDSESAKPATNEL